MKQVLPIYILLLIVCKADAGDGLMNQQPTVVADTGIVIDPVEEKIIAEVVKAKAPPKKEQVQYFSQVTRYGFKNLFAQYNYNPALPYSAQVNPNAEGYMQDYLTSHSKSLLAMKGWGQPYFNLIDNILSQYGLPRELKYLAVIESNLSTRATSWVGAGGPWQFMPYTAREYGLVVNNVLDERRDYYKSTHAAARYLLTLYSKMKDWLLVIAAYNGGPGRVYSAITKSGSRNFWALQYHLPTESRNHVKKFIATHYIMEGMGGVTTMPNLSGNYDPRGGINSFDVKPELSDEEKEFASTQTITGKFNALVISKNLAMDIATFNRYNPDFDNLMSVNGNYDLRLPADKMQLFLANKYTILNECVQLMLNDNPVPEQRQSIKYPASKSSGKKGG